MQSDVHQWAKIWVGLHYPTFILQAKSQFGQDKK
jgi:hypothetical protein